MVFIGKNQKGEGVRRLGSKRSPNNHNKAAETRMWPHFRSPDVARWLHPNGGDPIFCDFILSYSGFPVSAPGFDENGLYSLALN